MIFRRVYDDALAQASYIIGCERSREAIVVDPNLSTELYLAIAADEGLNIRAVTETHIHADFASGARRLAAATGADLHLSGAGGDDWRYEILGRPGVHELADGSELRAGEITLRAMHTPGHTPEHLSFVVTDRARSDAPVGALTGDFLFVGDVGRPDLLERAAGQAGTMRAAAAMLHRALVHFATLPDHLQIWPGHGAGSACGKAMSSAAQSTLGYERVANWALAPMPEEEFVERVLDGQPPAPPYFGAMKLLNRAGGPAASPDLPRRIGPHDLERLRSRYDDLFLLDVRNEDEWRRGHIAGATLIPLPELHSRLGELPRDRTIVVHCQLGARSAAGAATLDAAGFTDVHELTGGFAAWARAELPAEHE